MEKTMEASLLSDSFSSFPEKAAVLEEPRPSKLGLIILRWIFVLALILVFRSWFHNGFIMLGNARLSWTHSLSFYEGVPIKRAFSGAMHPSTRQSLPPQANKSINGLPLRVGEKSYEKGIGTHCPSEIVFDLGGRIKRFSCLVGVNAEADGAAILVFRVFADGQKLYESPYMSPIMEPLPVDLDVAGKKSLCLEVAAYGNYGPADWLEIKMERE
jgi:hypothetical protein